MYVQLLHLHVLLAVQDLLCVWFHAACIYDYDGGHGVCHHSVHLLSTQCRGLPMVRVLRGKGEDREEGMSVLQGVYHRSLHLLSAQCRGLLMVRVLRGEGGG